MNQQFYQVGGSLPSDAQSYIKREADDKLYTYLKENKYCYVLNARQVGKSSLRVQTSKRLENEGYTCINVDLTSIGSKNITADELYFSFAFKLIEVLKLDENEFADWWDKNDKLTVVNRFAKTFDKFIVKSDKQIIIFIDEVDSILGIQKDFSADDFFAVIRTFYNLRSEDERYNRISFALFGVATPEDLMRDSIRTPFNIAHSIKINQFKFKESLILTKGLTNNSVESQKILKKIFEWTSGMPYLTQKILDYISHNPIDSIEEIDKIVDILFIKENFKETNISDILNRIIKNVEYNVKMLYTIDALITKKTIKADDSRKQQIYLKLSGLVREEDGKLLFNNKIYEKIFNKSWVDETINKIDRPFSKDLQRWIKLGKVDSALLKGVVLEDAIKWSNFRKDITNQEYEYLQKSQMVEKEKERKKQRNKNIVLSLLSLALIIILSLYDNSIEAKHKIENNKIELQHHLGLVFLEKAKNAIEKKEYTKAHYFAYQALKNFDDKLDKENEKAIAQGIILSYPLLSQLYALDTNSSVKNIIIQDKQQRVLGNYKDGSVDIWDLKSSEKISTLSAKEVPLPHSRKWKPWDIDNKQVVNNFLKISKDGKIIVSNSNNQVFVWNLENNSSYTLDNELNQTLLDVSLSPNSKYILTEDKIGITLWNSSNGDKIYKKEKVGSISVSYNDQNISTDKTGLTNKKKKEEIISISISDNDQNISMLLKNSDIQICSLSKKDSCVTLNINGTDSNNSKNRSISLPNIDGTDSNDSNDSNKSNKPTPSLIKFNKFLMVYFDNGDINVLDIEKKEKVITLHTGIKKAKKIDLSNDMKKIILTTATSVSIWDIETGQQVLLIEENTDVSKILISKNNDFFIFGFENGLIKIYKKEKHIYTLTAHQSKINGLSISAQSDILVSTSDNGIMNVWDLNNSSKKLFKGHKGKITSLKLSFDDNLLVSRANDDTVKIWNCNNLKNIHSLSVHRVEMNGLSLSNTSKFIVEGKNNINICDIESGKCISNLPLNKNTSDFVISSDGSLAISSSWDNNQSISKIKIWDINRRDIIREFNLTNRIISIAISKNKKLFALGTSSGKIELRDIKGSRIKPDLDGHSLEVMALSFLDNDKKIVSASLDKTIIMWDLQKGKMDYSVDGYEGSTTTHNIAYSTKKDILVAPSVNKLIRIWSLKKGELLFILNISDEKIIDVALTKNGRYLFFNADNNIQMIDIEKLYSLNNKNFLNKQISFLEKQLHQKLKRISLKFDKTKLLSPTNKYVPFSSLKKANISKLDKILKAKQLCYKASTLDAYEKLSNMYLELSKNNSTFLGYISQINTQLLKKKFRDKNATQLIVKNINRLNKYNPEIKNDYIGYWHLQLATSYLFQDNIDQAKEALNMAEESYRILLKKYPMDTSICPNLAKIVLINDKEFDIELEKKCQQNIGDYKREYIYTDAYNLLNKVAHGQKYDYNAFEKKYKNDIFEPFKKPIDAWILTKKDSNNTKSLKNIWKKLKEFNEGKVDDIYEILVIIGDEDNNNNFSPSKYLDRPFIEIKRGLVGDTVLRECILKNALMNFSKKKREKEEKLKVKYSTDILIITNKKEIAIVFKTKKPNSEDEYTDDLPIIRYNAKDTESIISKIRKTLKRELEINEEELSKHRVSKEILTLLFPYKYNFNLTEDSKNLEEYNRYIFQLIESYKSKGDKENILKYQDRYLKNLYSLYEKSNNIRPLEQNINKLIEYYKSKKDKKNILKYQNKLLKLYKFAYKNSKDIKYLNKLEKILEYNINYYQSLNKNQEANKYRLKYLDTLNKLESFNKWQDILIDIVKYTEPKNNDNMSSNLSSLCWDYVFNGKFGQAKLLGENAIKFNENNMFAYGNLAHAYLFLNEFEKAKKIYLKYKNKTFIYSGTWEEAVLNDFNRLRENNITHPDMMKIEELLDLKNI